MQMLNPLAAFRMGVVEATFFHPTRGSLTLTRQRASTGFSILTHQSCTFLRFTQISYPSLSN